MTLALYGKSRRRQGGLLLLGVFAVFVALLAGMSVYRSERASAATAGPNYPSAANADGTYGDSWSNQNNAFADDGNYASHDAESSGTNALVVSGFGFSIPNDATINGITVVVEADTQGSGSGDTCRVDVALSWNTQTSFTAVKSLSVGASPTLLTFGGTSDAWGRTWSGGNFSDANFRVRVSAVDPGSSCGSSKDVRVDYLTVAVDYTPAVDTDGDGVTDANDTCPGTAPGATVDPANGCSFAQYLAAFGTGTGNGNPAPNVCAEANLSFVVDRSGSISDAEADAMRGGINAFTNAYETVGGGVGSYQLTTFNGTTATARTTGYEDLAGFTADAATWVNNDGSSYTPTQAGIQAGDAKNGGDADQHIMFVLTDGSPNRYSPPPGPGGPTDTALTATWVNSAAAAIAAANDARAAGFIVQAIWVETSDSMPFNTLFPGLVPSANLQFAKAVMDQIGGGSSYTTNFDTIASALLAASGCDPSIIKSDGTVDVNAKTITWTITINNLLGSAKAFSIEDAGATLTGSSGCSVAPTPGSGPWACTVAGNGQAGLTLTTPLPQDFNTCQGGSGVNTAYLKDAAGAPLGQDSGSWSVAADPNACEPETRNLTICKVVEGNGDLAVRNGEFKFDYYAQGSQTSNLGINASEPNPDQTPGAAGTKVCTTQPIPMPTDKQLTVSEWTGVRPAGWDTSANDAALYPKVQLGGGAISNNVSINIPAGTSDVTVTFYNREKLPTKNVTFQKYICNSLGDVAKNEESGGIDQVGMPSMSATGGLSGQLNQTAAPVGAGTAVNSSNDGRTEANCHLWGTGAGETGDWFMDIYDTGRTTLLQKVNIPAGGTVSVPLAGSVLLEALKANSNGARVEEELRDGYGFGSLKCYTDHKNQDNWEWLDFNPGGIPSGEVYCIAYNVPADREIVIEKQFVELNGTTPVAGDLPTFTLDPSQNTSCAAPVQKNPTTWTVTCTVPYDWDGTVTETPAAGWEKVTCDEPGSVLSQVSGLVQSITEFQARSDFWEFCNRPVGTVVVVKYENVPPATSQQWNFNGTLPGAPVALSTTGTTNATGTSSTTLLNVPAGSYTLAELQGHGVCETGTNSFDYQTRGLTGSTLPSASDVNAAPIIGANDLNVTVQKGATTYVAFGNQGCGTVLSAANLQVFKYSDPAANFTGATELAGWTISITGTAGAAAGFNASEDTVAATGAFFLGIPDGTYTVCETPKANWVVIGSKYNATNQAGVCRTGVVVNLDQTVVVNFYNQPRVNIEVNKTEISLATPAGAPGNGWSFTLTGCDIVGSKTATTGANGKATFSDLSPAVGCSYTVTETVKGGWSAINPVQVTAPAAAGHTSVLGFTNVKIEVCTNCITIVTPTPTTTPTTPATTPTPETPTPETPTPETPAATPETPTAEPTGTEDTAGERTPGPQTPIAPSTGTGLMGGGSSGMSMLFALVGLVAISLGTTILALGRKASRR